MKYRDEKQRNGSRGAYGMNAGNETRIMAAWILPAACDSSCRTSYNGHLALRLSEQIGWQGRKRSWSPVAWRVQVVNKKQRLLSLFQIGNGISCRQLVAPALEDILRWRMKIYCDGGWIYTAMADADILRWQMQIYCDVGWIYIWLFMMVICLYTADYIGFENNGSSRLR